MVPAALLPAVSLVLAQNQAAAPSAATVFYLTLLFIFVTAIVTTVVTKWARDKCLKFFNHYHVTLERVRGQTTWGKLKVFSSGVEVVYDHPYVDHRGRKKNSYLIYQQELEQQVLSVFRYHGELSEADQRARVKQVKNTFNPGPLRRLWRGVRNFINTLRDAFNAAIGAVVGQYQKLNPANAVLSTQGQQVTTISQTLLGRFANAYEPLLAVGHDLAVRLDGPRVKVMNARHECVVVRRLEREGFQPLELGTIVPPSAVLDLPARDARGGKLFIEVVRCLDVVAPRKFATVRHAGELHERRGLVDELHLDRLPLVPLVLGREDNDGEKARPEAGHRVR